MSDASLAVTIWRIEVATKLSPIAVFKSSKPGCLNSMFASTIETQRMIAQGHPGLLGVFDNSMNLRAVKAHLSESIGAEVLN